MPTSHEVLYTRSAGLLSALSSLAQVRAVLCFGSYAMGTSDASSDIDLYVVCHPQIAAVIERQAAFGQAGEVVDLLLDHDQPGWENQWCPRNDRLRLDGMQFDIIYNTLDWVRSVVHQVTTTGAVVVLINVSFKLPVPLVAALLIPTTNARLQVKVVPVAVLVGV